MQDMPENDKMKASQIYMVAYKTNMLGLDAQDLNISYFLLHFLALNVHPFISQCYGCPVIRVTNQARIHELL